MQIKSRESTRVLVVDDDCGIRQVIAVALSRLGCHCVLCSNTSEALHRFAVQRFQLIITDLSMPGVDGLGFLGMIRSQVDTPILVISGRAEEYAYELKKYSQMELLRKPFTREQLVTRVSRAFARQRELPAITRELESRSREDLYDFG